VDKINVAYKDAVAASSMFIGVLDIFGFENFKVILIKHEDNFLGKQYRTVMYKLHQRKTPKLF
jgi:hypothetical protein